MKRTILFAAMFLLLSQMLRAQGRTDSIEYKRFWLGSYKWIKYDGKKIRKFSDLGPIVNHDPQAGYYYKKAKRNHVADAVLVWSGLACLAYYDTRILTGTPTNDIADQNVAYVGFGLLCVSIPFGFTAIHNYRKAINTYNADLHKTGLNELKPEYYLSVSPRAVGLVMKF